MEYSFSSESDSAISEVLSMIEINFEKYITEKLLEAPLDQLHCKLRYVPIVMAANFLGRYPARSRLRKKENLYDCAPQLNHDTFLYGKIEDVLDEYIRGLMPAVPQFAKLGASPEQIAALAAVIENAPKEIIPRLKAVPSIVALRRFRPE